ncbi:MAG: acyl-CoA dehydrogenase family protein [Rhizobiales bacterium]|nr:acyl-CoA dehydrogenase family protein [Hyphomicrobiales bacterium]NRB13284.1 acyl-CoA dehydrogenase family protein [Hyphomicrobiales bacterium]
MDFKLTEDRRMLEDTISRFLADKYSISKRNDIAYSETGHSAQIWAEMAELGIVAALFTEIEGGFVGQGFDIALVFEALGRALCPEPFLGALLTGKALAAGGAEHADWLNSIVSGEKIGAVAFEEDQSHYQLQHVATSATKTASGYLINGNKAVVTHVEAADIIIISARLSGNVDDQSGLGIFAVAADIAGLEIQDYANVEGGRSGQLTLTNVALPPEALLAEGDAAFELLETIAGYAHLALSAEALGIMEVLKFSTIEFLNLRQQFGVPIGKFQALQHRMVELVLDIEQARSAVINASTLPCDKIDRAKRLSAAKLTVSATGTKVAEEAIQMHGGIGMTWEMPVSHFAKRLVMIEHLFGDEDYHLARYIELSKV